MKTTTILARTACTSRTLLRRSPSTRSFTSGHSARPLLVIAPLQCRLQARQPALAFSTTSPLLKGLQPDSSEPTPPKTEPSHGSQAGASPASISETEYHELADTYLNSLVHSLEETAEDSSKGLEVEYSAGVLTLTTPTGTYVLNKQPPNKQIWLSSPISGPKRYDWVISGDAQHMKEGTETHDDGAGGKWIYLRDGSELTDLLEKEVDVEVVIRDNASENTKEGQGMDNKSV